MIKQIPLTELEAGETGTIVEIIGGRDICRRLRALGISTGINITKISAVLGGGPVILQVDNTQVALGLKISQKVIVEVER